MHVLNILQCTNLGGTEQGALRLMQTLASLGHSSEVVSLHPPGAFAPKLIEARIPLTTLHYRGMLGWRSHWAVRRAFRKTCADSLIMHGPTVSGVLALGKVCAGHRILAVHYHHNGGEHSAWAWRRLYGLIVPRFQFVTFCSDFIRREAESLCPGIARQSRTVMYSLRIPPVPTSDERKQARTRLNLPLDRPLIGNAGWFIPRKRFDVFLRVAAEVLKTHADAEFVLAGDGSERTALARLSEELGLANRVHWLGWQSELTDFYRSIDILQFNSDWDAMGLTCLEAASHGVPVVASVLNGGLGEVLGEASGCVLREHSIEMLGKRCTDLLAAPATAIQAGLAGRAQVAARCAPNVVASQYDEMLRSTWV